MGKHYNEACGFLVGGCSSHVTTLSGGDDQICPTLALQPEFLEWPWSVPWHPQGKDGGGHLLSGHRQVECEQGVLTLVFIRILWLLHKNAESAGRGPGTHIFTNIPGDSAAGGARPPSSWNTAV